MTSREIVKRAITFNNPPRMPLKFDIVGVNDCYDVWTPDPTGWTWNFDRRRSDEWGCVWEHSAVSNTGQVVGHPLADWSALADYAWPDPDDSRRYDGFAQQLAGAGDKFVMFCFGQGIWERYHMLRGMQNALLDFYTEPARAHELIEHILDHHLRVFRNCVQLAGGRLDAAALADDWGMQSGAFISVEFFREFFKPAYKKWFDRIKTAGCHTWMHSCGRINDIVEELIDVGLEVINNQQPNTVGIDEFGARYRGRICFEAIVDTQNTLPSGTLDEIRAEAERLVDAYGTASGGFIASDYNDAEAIGVTTERRLVMFEAFARKGNYPDYQSILKRAQPAPPGHSWGRQTTGKTPDRC
ncbi:MAG: uroporphyrinogen decarboxylase family protein [Planctomycetota bacterium]